MTKLNLSSLFTSEVLASSFDLQVNAEAAQGRVHKPFIALLATAYGLELPVSGATVPCLRKINALMAIETTQKLKKGAGSKVAAVAVWQALHALGDVLLAGMGQRKRAELPADFKVNPLPAWACPLAIQAKADKAKADKEAKQAAKDAARLASDLAESEAAGAGDGVESEAAPVTGEAVSAETLTAALAEVPRDLHAEAMQAWLAFAKFLDAGVITAAERDAFTAELEKAVTAPEVIAPEVKAAHKVAQKAAQQVQNAEAKAREAVALASFKSGEAAPVTGESVAEAA